MSSARVTSQVADPPHDVDGAVPDGEAPDVAQNDDAHADARVDDAAPDADARDGGSDHDAGTDADTADASDARVDAPDADTNVDASDAAFDSGLDATDAADAHDAGPPPDGKSCAQPIDITAAIANGGAYSGKTLGSAHEQASCSDKTAPAAYLVANLGGGNFRLDVKSHKPLADPSASDATVIVRNVDCTYVTMEAICNASAATQATQFGTALAGNTYFIVQGDYFSDGFDLTLTKLGVQCDVDSDCKDFPGARCNWLNGACVTDFKCPRGKGDCDRNPVNGCEVDTTSDVNNCGACGGTCLGQHDSTGGSCAAGVCTLTCAPNKADCNGATYDGCEADLTTDSATCGTCGTSCNGATCSAGGCAAVSETVTTVSAASYTLGLGPSEVYVLTGLPSDYARSLFVSGKAPASSALLLANDVRDFAVAPDGSFVDWVSTYEVKRRLASSGLVSTTSPSTTTSTSWHTAIVTDGTSDWIFDQEGAYPPATLRYLAGGSSTLTQVSQTQGQTPGELLWTKAGVVFRTQNNSPGSWPAHSAFFTVLPFDGGPMRQIGAPYTGAVGYAADDTTLWYGGDGLYAVPLAGGASVKMWSAVGGVTGSQPYVFAITSDAANVYFAAIPPFDGWHYRSYVYRMPKSGGAATMLVDDNIGGQNQGGSLSGPFIAVDDTYLYWTAGQSVKRVAK